jgi:glycosyltransferase involved in cell wall biosynthesis
MKTILYLIETLKTGGKEKRLLLLLKNLDYKKYKVYILVADKEIFFREIHDLPLNLYFAPDIFKNKLQYLLDLNKLLNKIRPDIVHSWGQMCTFYASILKPVYRYCLLNSQIASSTFPKKYSKSNFFINKFNFFFSDLIISNSRKGLLTFNAPENKSKLIYNGISLNKKPLQSGAFLDLLKDKKQSFFIVAMIAAFSDYKDWDTFLETANQLTEKNKNFCFLCIGDGPNLKHYQNEFQSDKIIFPGNIADIESCLYYIDLGVLTTFGEGISNSVLEMMKYNIPVIATDAGAMNEIIENNLNGILVPLKDKTSLVDAIMDLYENKEKADQISINACKTLTQKFDLDNMTSGFENIYDKMGRI